MRSRRTAYTRGGHKVRVNIHDGQPTSYRVAGRPLMRVRDFQSPEQFFYALRQALSASPRPRGLPRV